MGLYRLIFVFGILDALLRLRVYGFRVGGGYELSGGGVRLELVTLWVGRICPAKTLKSKTFKP